jgi:hypothetical protein
MSYSKSIAVVLTAVVCATALAADADAQSRRGGGGGSRGGSVGRAVPRGGGGFRGGGVRVAPRIVSSRVLVARPFRTFYYPYRPGLSLAFYGGYGFGYGGYGYGYPYAYGYPYGYYGYGYPYGYPPYGYGGYARGGYGGGYGGVRIQGAPHEAQVFADGYYAGNVDDFDGAFQHLDLEGGAHQIEIRIPGQPPLQYDVNVQPGQTLNLHVR